VLRDDNTETLQSAIRLLEAFHNSNGAATRFLASRNPADAGAAKNELAVLEREAEGLKAATAENRRVQRFLNAMAEPLKAYAGGVDALLAASEKFTAASAERQKNAEALVAAATEMRRSGVEVQRAGIAAMVDAVAASRRFGMIIAGAALLGGLFLAWRIGRGIIRPIAAITGTMEALAGGDHSVAIPQAQRRDEIGAMARAVEVFKTNALEVERLRLENEANERRAAEERRTQMLALADRFEATIGQVVRAVADAAGRTEQTSQVVASAVQKTEQQAAAVAAASGRPRRMSRPWPQPPRSFRPRSPR
jgi:methyl-accepting chemotaxis protein